MTRARSGGLTTTVLWNRRRSLAGLISLLAGVAPGHACALERPTQAAVLTLTGRVRNRNHSDGDAASFDMPMLAALPQHEFETRTPWYAQPRRFTGPLLRDVLTAAGAHGQLLRLKALNDYQVDMPWDDSQRYDVLVARLLDGQPMSVRDKGPLMVVYPFDTRPELKSAVFYSRSAWQLRQIDVL